MKTVYEFHEKGSLCRSLNTSLISIIPKKQGILKPNEFHHIILLNSFYKVLSKALARRMEHVMEIIISPSQNAFVKGWQMLDYSLIAIECIDYWRKTKLSRIVCQIDMKKAYDHVN